MKTLSSTGSEVDNDVQRVDWFQLLVSKFGDGQQPDSNDSNDSD